VILVIGSLHAFVASRLFAHSALPPAVRFSGWGLFFIAFAVLPLSVLATLFRWGRTGALLRRAGHFWLGAFFLLLSTTVLTEPFFRGAAAFGSLTLGVGRDAQSIAIAVLGALAIGIALAVGRLPPRVKRRRIAIPHLGAGMDGLRLVQLSDLHLGLPGSDRRFVEDLVRRIHELGPDAIALTGDIVEGGLGELEPIVAPLAGLRAPLGVYLVMGNHEYYYGGRVWEDHFRRLGITVLTNEHRVLERGGSRLVLGGVPDFNAGLFDADRASRPEQAFAGAPEGAARVLLAHQPRSAFAAAAARVDLQLSGHTHGGQIFPFHFLVRLQQPTWGGLRRIGGVPVYTHPGTGYWGPRMRLGTRAEIAEITLRASADPL
jgi:predicted MPP superfamily phosphohydrolase